MDISGIRISEIMSSGVVSGSVVAQVHCHLALCATDHLVVVSERGLGQGTHKYQHWPKCIAAHVSDNFYQGL